MDMRELLARQGDIPWSFLQRFVFSSLSEDMLHWEPSANTLAVRQRSPNEWIADWPTAEQEESAQATAAWVLWHMEWWLGNTVRCERGMGALTPEAYHWTGSLETSCERIGKLHADWSDAVSAGNLERILTGPMPNAEPLAFVAAWVTFELTKNAAELRQIVLQHANIASKPDKSNFKDLAPQRDRPS